MKTLIRVFFCTVLVGCSALPKSSAFMPNSDTYKIQWTGTNGSKLFGAYGIASKNHSTPMRVEKVTAVLPYKITFSAPKNTRISASGITWNQTTVEIKIFRNGIECGKPVFVGSGAMANKTCQ